MKRIRSSTSDIISNLPSNVTEHILKYLSLRDAVRTSVLSNRWRYKWVTLPQLVFDDQFFLKSWGNGKLKAIVYKVLLLHQGSLIKFKLRVPPFGSCLDINNWILILLKKNIQKFTLRLRMGPYHKCPCHLFSFLQLRHLNLSTCVFKPPPTFKGFSRLVNLKLQNVVIVEKNFGSFISNCPLLEQLRLDDCSSFDFLEINAPNLKVFSFLGIFKLVSFKSTPLLAEISIALLSLDGNVKLREEGKDTDLVNFFHCLPSIENLNLDSNLLKFLAVGNVPKRLPSTLNHLKVLFLSDVSYHKLDLVSCVLCLIRSSPNLEKLKISLRSLNHFMAINDPVVEFLQAQDFTNLSLNQLRKVKMQHFSGVEPEMHFVKILLAHSTILEKMKILVDQGTSDGIGFTILKELTQFPRASPKAEVLYRSG